jgi:hypothetical protein
MKTIRRLPLFTAQDLCLGPEACPSGGDYVTWVTLTTGSDYTMTNGDTGFFDLRLWFVSLFVVHICINDASWCLHLLASCWGHWAGAGFLAKYCKQTNKLNKLSKKSFEPCLVKVQTLHASCNLQMLASHCCKISCDDNVPCNELMLHNTMLCTGASCKTPRIPSKFAQILRDLKILTPNGQDHIVLRCFYIQRCSCTGMLLHYTRVLWRRDAFHKDRFLQTDVCTYGCFCPGTKRCLYTQILPLCTGAFTRDAVTQSSFHTHTDAQVLLHRCLYTALHVHRNAFAHMCFYTGILVTQSIL